MTFHPEDKLQTYNRLSRHKSLDHNIHKSHSKLSLTTNSNQNFKIGKEKYTNQSSDKLKHNNSNSQRVLKSSKSYNTDLESLRRVRTKITIREQKSENEIYCTIDELNNQSNKLKKSLSKKIKENMGKYRLNNLKEVFEVIFSKCNSFRDIQNLEKFGISNNMKDNIILPSLHMIQQRKLEFNFQNFYVIANEIINTAI